MAGTKPDWTYLPEDLLALIASFLPEQSDLRCLSAVCRSFRSRLPLPERLLFPPSILTATDFLRVPYPFLRCPDSGENDLYVLTEATVYAIQPVDNKQALAWLIKVEKTKSGMAYWKDPLSRLRFRLSRKFPKFLNLLDYKVTEITTSYELETAASLKNKCEFGYGEYSKLNYGAAKVTLTSCVDKSDEEFAVMAKFRGRRLCMWRNIDKKWSDINLVFDPPWCYRNIYIEDIIYHNKKFYVLLSSGVTMTVDSKSLGVTKVGRELSDLDCDFMLYLLYLLESHNNLFLIAKFPAKKDSEDCLKVFKLDEENRRWVRVVNELEFEGRVIFLSEDGSYSLSAKELRPCKENCVYFKKEIRVGENRYPGEDAWIFNLKTRKDKKLSKFPGYAASLFWPPPSWLKQ